MNLTDLRQRCLGKPGAEEGYPFGPGALVMKVRGKIFAIIADEEDPVTVSLKCEPEIVDLLRSSYQAVRPGYHLNKRHWNTVTLDGTIDDELVFGWIDDSYDLVVQGLPRRIQDEIAGLPKRGSRRAVPEVAARATTSGRVRTGASRKVGADHREVSRRPSKMRLETRLSEPLHELIDGRGHVVIRR